MEDRKTQYFQCAVELLKSGQRPSADQLVHRCGGSKTTALAALDQFWSKQLPDLIAGNADFNEAIPQPVREAAMTLWSTANTAATEAATAIYASTKAELAVQIALTEKAQAERDAALAQITTLQEENSAHKAKVEFLGNEVETLNANLHTEQEAYRISREALAEAESQIDQLKAEQAQERAQAAESIKIVTTALKEAHASELKRLTADNTLLLQRLASMQEERDRAIAQVGQSHTAPSKIRSRLRVSKRKVKSEV